MRFRRTLRRDKPIGGRYVSPHVVYTECQDLDEALDILRHRQSTPRAHNAPTLRQEFAMNAGRQRFKRITLSDRTVRPVKDKPRTRMPDRVWTREEVIAAHKTGAFKWGELARLAKVHSLQIQAWLYGPEYKPLSWRCMECGSLTSATEAAKRGDDPVCHKCGMQWNAKL